MSMEGMTKAPPGGEPDGAEEITSQSSDNPENKPNGHDSQADSAPAPGALTHKRIVFLNADGNEVQAGSPDAVSVQTEGFELISNGDFRVAAIYPHPNPPLAFDRGAIWAHIQALFALAQGARGKFVALALTGDKADPPYEIKHFLADGGEAEIVRGFWGEARQVQEKRI